ncbi:MAG: hypothetical protein AB1631_27585 [Acidobacteriota bacterium]
MRQIDTHTEISPSQTGLHLFVKAKLPLFTDPKTGELKSKGLNKRNWHGRKIEIYNSGRFFTVTGLHLESTPKRIEDRQAETIALYNRVVEETERKPTGQQSAAKSRVNSQHQTNVSDDDLIRRMNASPKFEDLFTGGAHSYPSDSEADFAFVSMLCRTTDDDEQIKRIWRMSGLYRQKLEREDYLDRTIANARARQGEREQERQAAPLTHREQIICKMAAVLGLSDKVFRTLLAILSFANGRKQFRMAGWKLAAWIRTPEGWDAVSWKHSAENDFDSEQVKKTRAVESDFGSESIRQVIEAFEPIYPILIIREKGGGFHKDGRTRPPTKYALDLRPVREAEALAEKKLPERLKANQLRFPLDPDLARQIAEHEARERAAIEVANRYLPKQTDNRQTESKNAEGDPVTELYRRESRLKDRILSDVRKLAEVWQDLNDSNAEAVIKKGQLLKVIDESLSAAFSPEFRLKLKRRKRHLFSPKKQGLNNNA